jgi:hypothetical protein
MANREEVLSKIGDSIIICLDHLNHPMIGINESKNVKKIIDEIELGRRRALGSITTLCKMYYLLDTDETPIEDVIDNGD